MRRTVGIVGLGLIGGSIAKALKRKGEKYKITGWDISAETINQALSEGVIDFEASSEFKEFSSCDIIFICVPVFYMEEIIQKLIPFMKPECIISDVGSTKSDVESIIKEHGLMSRYIGGHPMAGSELSGYKASKSNLFENAFYVLTHDETVLAVDSDIIRQIILDMGAIPLEMNSREHDRVTAVISHVPHIVASLLVNLVADLDGSEGYMKTLAAGGFKDITRIASSSPELWTGICISNHESVLSTLSKMESIIEQFIKDLTVFNEKGIHSYFKSARELRNSFSDLNKGMIQKAYGIIVDVDDKPGIIALIASALAKQNINIKNIGIINNRENDEGALEIRFEDEESMKKGMTTLNELGYTVKERP